MFLYTYLSSFHPSCIYFIPNHLSSRTWRKSPSQFLNFPRKNWSLRKTALVETTNEYTMPTRGDHMTTWGRETWNWQRMWTRVILSLRHWQMMRQWDFLWLSFTAGPWDMISIRIISTIVSSPSSPYWFEHGPPLNINANINQLIHDPELDPTHWVAVLIIYFIGMWDRKTHRKPNRHHLHTRARERGPP